MHDRSTDLLFLNKIAPRLKQFKQKSNKLWNCRCPICGDSKASKFKTRGYFGYNKSNMLAFYCHNCLKSMTLGNLINQCFPDVYNEYIFHKFKTHTKEETHNEPDAGIFKQAIKFKKTDVFNECIPITDLGPSEPARRYTTDRKIPGAFLQNLYLSKDFKALVATIDPEKSKNLKSEPRIIIPFYDENKELLGFQGRAIGASKIKYITIKLTEARMIYGLDRVNLGKPVYVFEGPIDSMFIDNGIAAASSALSNLSIGNDMVIYHVYDNQPKNKEIVSIMSRAIDKGQTICIWPKDFQHKDVNDAVMAGMQPEHILSIINNSLCRGIQAKLKLSQWRKI